MGMGKPRVPFPALQFRHHSIHNDADSVLWEDSPSGNRHPVGWTGSPSHSSAFQATRNPSLRDGPSTGILEHSSMAANTRESWGHTWLWGHTQATASEPNPTGCGKSKWSHSRITSIHLHLLLMLLSHTAPRQSKEPQCNRAQASQPCWISDLFFFFPLLIYHPAGLQTHPSLRMLHLSSPIRQERGWPGWSRTHSHTHPARRKTQREASKCLLQMKCETRFQENKGNRATINISWWESSDREG